MRIIFYFSFLHFAFKKSVPFKNNTKKKTLRNCRYLVNTTLTVYLFFLQTHVFWNFCYISRTYNQISYRNIWFAKVIITLIRTAQVFSTFFLKKACTLMSLSISECANSLEQSTKKKFYSNNIQYWFHYVR